MTDARDALPAEILSFWREAGRDRWYRRDDAFDAQVRTRYLELWRKAAAGGLSSWEASDDGALALTLVLDQFPRNMFRGDAQTYASDPLAREVATSVPAGTRTSSGSGAESQNVTPPRAAVGGNRRTPISSRNLT